MNRILTLAITIPLGMLPALMHAQTESVIYDFDNPVFPADGCPGQNSLGPRAGLYYHQNHLYSTTPSGGGGVKGEPDTRDGMVFKLALPAAGETDGVRKILHSFINNAVDGAYPCSRLIPGKHGVLYGTTSAGGAHSWGSVFEMTPPPAGVKGWTETVLYSFQGGADGGNPYDGLVMDDLGNLYGTTTVGGAGSGLGNGTVFQIVPPHSGQPLWTKNTVYEFGGGDDGYYPNGDLLFDLRTFTLLGTTQYGGLYGSGTVFQLSLPGQVQPYWNKTTLWSFDPSEAYSAANPNGGLLGGPGALFGTTQNGGASGTGGCCGIVFFLWQEYADDPDYTLVVLHQFTDGSDGATPAAGLFLDASNTFWGTTMGGGSTGNGTVFKLVPDQIRVNVWHYSVAYNFLGGNDGAVPESPLTADGAGNLYGTTNAGGVFDSGTVFKLTP